jgi:phage shock protein A
MNYKEIKVTAAEASGKIAPTRAEEGATAQPMSPTEANEAVIRVVSSWEGVSAHEHRFGGVEFRVGRRELGHLHATFADLPFPRKLRDELIAAGRANPHHVLPESGWVTVPMRTTAEVADVIELLRQNYRRATSARD